MNFNHRFLAPFAARLFKACRKFRRENRCDRRFPRVHAVTTRHLMHLDSTGGHPAPPKKWIFLKQVAWRLMFCPEKVDPPRKGHQFVASTCGKTNFLDIKTS